MTNSGEPNPALFEWLMSLNPIVLDVDEEGKPTDPSQVAELKQRIQNEIKEAENEQQQ